jgi:Zn-finger nucleic acid-binding protein
MTPLDPTIPDPTCPTCHAVLQLGAVGGANVWSCPNGHGIACTVTAAYGRLQDDEIKNIWHRSENAIAGSRSCPMCGKPMVEVSAGVDAEEASDGEAGDGADTATVVVDVCRDDEVFWLDSGELDEFPKDIPTPEPSEQDLKNLETVRQTFIAGIDEGTREEATSGVFNRLANLVSARHPAFRGMFSDTNPPTSGSGSPAGPAAPPPTDSDAASQKPE